MQLHNAKSNAEIETPAQSTPVQEENAPNAAAAPESEIAQPAKADSPQISTPKDKIVEQESPVVADPPAPATAVQDKNPKNILELSAVRQSAEELAQTKKAEGDKKIQVEN